MASRNRRAIVLYTFFIGQMLSGCSGETKMEVEAREAEERYQMVQANGNRGDLCRAARELEEVYYKAKMVEKWKKWRLTAAIDCTDAERAGYLRAGNQDY